MTFTWAPGEGAPEELFEPFEDDRFVLRGELDDDERARLLAIREQRPQPLRDDKAIASWNGLALAAFAQAGRIDTAGRASRSSCSARCRRPTGVFTAPGATVSRRERATSRTTPTSRTA